jgi:hypothetical protein
MVSAGQMPMVSPHRLSQMCPVMSRSIKTRVRDNVMFSFVSPGCNEVKPWPGIQVKHSRGISTCLQVSPRTIKLHIIMLLTSSSLSLPTSYRTDTLTWGNDPRSSRMEGCSSCTGKGQSIHSDVKHALK